MTLATIGRFHFLEQARALSAAGGLDRFYCDDPRVLAAVGWRRGRWLARAGVFDRYGGSHARAASALAWRGAQVAQVAAGSALVKINSAFALETLRGGQAGAVWVDHCSLDERYVSAHMQAEAERWGDDLVAAGGNHGSPILVERQAEEFGRATGVVVASDLARRSLAARGVDPGKIRVVHLGVDAARFSPRGNTTFPGRFRILHAGPVTFNKGVHRLIDAFRMAALPGAELRIVGPVPDARVRERLESQAAGLRVEFHPPVRQSRLPELFAESDLFVLASLADGFGLTVLQAMACALPALVTDQCGCAEVLTGCPAAQIVRAADSAGLAAALTVAYEQREPNADRGGAARSWVQRLSWEAHAACLRPALNAGDRSLEAKS